MIPRLASPSVCLIDDEPEDYKPILDALLNLGLGCLHVRGDNSQYLPLQPFNGLRIVFTDLHLANSTGKSTASHTANIFKQVVSTETAPVIVVIWSKYASDKVNQDDLPPDDQPTEAESFKMVLLESEPKFKDRLLFLEMNKPKPPDRPEEKQWVEDLQKQIQDKLKDFPAFDVLWAWETMVRNAGIAVSEGLTAIASSSKLESEEKIEASKAIHDKLQIILQHLVKAQGEPDCSADTAPRHLASVLSQYLTDQLEHSEGYRSLSHHGDWLIKTCETKIESDFAPHVNGLLLTEAHSTAASSFLPGTIYRLTALSKFEDLFHETAETFIEKCFIKTKDSPKFNEWKTKVKIVFVEISPACDVAQGKRRNAMLLSGLIVPNSLCGNAHDKDSYQALPSFSLRWPLEDFKEEITFLVFCSLYKITFRTDTVPYWLQPWFRLRELPTASLRNWHSSHASRVGYVSLR